MPKDQMSVDQLSVNQMFDCQMTNYQMSVNQNVNNQMPISLTPLTKHQSAKCQMFSPKRHGSINLATTVSYTHKSLQR